MLAIGMRSALTGAMYALGRLFAASKSMTLWQKVIAIGTGAFLWDFIKELVQDKDYDQGDAWAFARLVYDGIESGEIKVYGTPRGNHFKSTESGIPFPKYVIMDLENGRVWGQYRIISAKYVRATKRGLRQQYYNRYNRKPSTMRIDQ